MNVRIGLNLVVVVQLAFSSVVVIAQETCGSLASPGQYGPYDYRTERQKLEIVEGTHFLPFVENLSRGNTGVRPGGDIDYTLRASPNHHRALLAMMNLAVREKTDKSSGSRYTVSCWLERAERFRPDDAMVKVLSGIYLLRLGKSRDAVAKLEEAVVSGQNDGNVYYNLGLAYFELKNYDKALENAHRAYRAGFPLPGLRNKLTAVGKWRDLPPAVAAQPNADDTPVAGSDAKEAAAPAPSSQ
jgi:tetratricopeptide (TPR) repeat protein